MFTLISRLTLNAALLGQGVLTVGSLFPEVRLSSSVTVLIKCSCTCESPRDLVKIQIPRGKILSGA